jgi:formylglycine-generating enzyme required for sulfatase activity
MSDVDGQQSLFIPVAPDHTVTIRTGSLSNNHLYSVMVSTNHMQWSPITNVVGSGSNFAVRANVPDGWHKVTYRYVDMSAGQVGLRPSMVWIPPGNFMMGSPITEAERFSDETLHKVTLTKGFYMSKYLVTQGEYLSLMKSNPSFFSGPMNLPVDSVNWNDATSYCAALTQQEQLAGRLPTGWAYQLPTEAQWEYACRSGSTTAFFFGNTLRGAVANFSSSHEYDARTGTTLRSRPVGYNGQTTPVGSYRANAWGLFDMCGNLCEWCQDWYGPYPTGSATDPTGAITGSNHPLRGGAWDGFGTYCRSALRFNDVPINGHHDFGFRTVMAPIQR